MSHPDDTAVDRRVGPRIGTEAIVTLAGSWPAEGRPDARDRRRAYLKPAVWRANGGNGRHAVPPLYGTAWEAV